MADYTRDIVLGEPKYAVTWQVLGQTRLTPFDNEKAAESYFHEIEDAGELEIELWEIKASRIKSAGML